VTFEWNPPLGSGPIVIVDKYRITITPKPLSQNISIPVYSTTLEVSIEYNTIYTANIVSINCAGESEAHELTSIEYGEHKDILSWHNNVNSHFLSYHYVLVYRGRMPASFTSSRPFLLGFVQ
jgi:hypothetical protein